MAKELRCRDTGMNCDFVMRAESEGEIMKKALEHARKSHGMKELTPDMNAKMRAAIRNAQDQGPQMSPALGRKGTGEGAPETAPGFGRKGGGEGTQTPPGIGRKGPSFP